MTLTSRIRIQDPINPETLHAWVTRMLAGDDREVRFLHERHQDGTATFRNRVDQGLLALAWTTYGLDGPLPVDADDFPDAAIPSWRAPTPACLQVSIDTPYGYRADNGASCDDLHAWIIAQLGEHLDGAGVSCWWWRHEYTGDWYPGHTMMPNGEDSAQLYVLGDVERGDPNATDTTTEVSR